MAPGLSNFILKLSDVTGFLPHEATTMFFLVLAVVLGVPFRTLLHPSKVTATTRHSVACVVGFYFSFYIHSWGMIFLLLQALSCYILIVSMKPPNMHKVVFLVAMGFLVVANLKDLLQGYSRNIVIVTMMIFTEKISSLAWSIHDGFAEDTELSDHNRKLAVRRIPTIIEYLSYLFHFQSLVAGPFCFFKHYADFIEGRHTMPYTEMKDGKEVVIAEEPPVTASVVKKLVIVILLILVFYLLGSKVPLVGNLDKSVHTTPFIYLVLYPWACLWLAVHPIYFFTWILADVACNISGFGFNGYDENGQPKWDLTSNVYLKPYLFSSNLKLSIDNWHMSVNRWLKYVCYDRLPSSNKASMTILLSLLWHGFLPGYLWFYGSAMLLIMAQKKGRIIIRPYFTTSKPKKLFYDVVTWAGHWTVLSYMVMMFQLRDNTRILKFGRANYFWGQIVVITMILLLPSAKKSYKKLDDNLANTDATQTDKKSHNSDTDAKVHRSKDD